MLGRLVHLDVSSSDDVLDEGNDMTRGNTRALAAALLGASLLLGACGGSTTAEAPASQPSASAAPASAAAAEEQGEPAAEASAEGDEGASAAGTWAPPMPTGIDPADDLWVSLGADPATKDADSLAAACASLPLVNYTEEDFQNNFLAFYPMSSLEEWNALIDYVNATLPAYCG